MQVYYIFIVLNYILHLLPLLARCGIKNHHLLTFEENSKLILTIKIEYTQVTIIQSQLQKQTILLFNILKVSNYLTCATCQITITMCNPLKFFVKRTFLIIICVFNMVLTLSGVACFAIGIILLAYGRKFNLIFSNHYSGVFAGIVLLLIGFILLGLGFIGNISACCGCNVLLYAYGVVLSIFVLFQMVGAISGVSKISTYDNDLTDNLMEWYTIAFKSYNSNSNIQYQLDTLQSTFHCCGAERPNEFVDKYEIDLPKSCCKNPNKDCSINSKNSYHISCGERFKKFIASIKYFFIVMIFVSLAEILFLVILGAFICKFL